MISHIQCTKCITRICVSPSGVPVTRGRSSLSLRGGGDDKIDEGLVHCKGVEEGVSGEVFAFLNLSPAI